MSRIRIRSIERYAALSAAKTRNQLVTGAFGFRMQLRAGRFFVYVALNPDPSIQGFSWDVVLL